MFSPMKRLIFGAIIILIFAVNLSAQVVVTGPFAAEQSHPDLNIDKIVFNGDSTTITLTVVNKLDNGGWFCADKNIYIENPSTHKRYYILHSAGIPTCPDTYNFRMKGEKLSFSLAFPPFPLDSKTLNLVEDCNKSCFSFKGVILDEKLNKDIRTFNRGMEYYTANKTAEAVACFIKVIAEIPPFPTHVYGYSYYHLVIIYQNKGDDLTANYWLDQLKQSSLPDKQYFIDAIRKNNEFPQ